jgi:hypothetical protein
MGKLTALVAGHTNVMTQVKMINGVFPTFDDPGCVGEKHWIAVELHRF